MKVLACLKIIQRDDGRIVFVGLMGFVKYLHDLRARLAEAAAKGREEYWGGGKPN